MVFVNKKHQVERRRAARRGAVLFVITLGASSYWGAYKLGYRPPGERTAVAAEPESQTGVPEHIEVTPELVTRGTGLYAKACVVCHGEEGAGKAGQGPRLASQSYLAAASDAMLFTTIAKGRPGTLMVPWEVQMSRDDVIALVAYIRSLAEHEPAELDEAPLGGDATDGAAIYKSHCAECHGASGKGYNETVKGTAKGTAISNSAFLQSVSDGFLRQMIKVGKSETEMKGFDAGAPDQDKTLTAEQIENVIAYLRSGTG